MRFALASLTVALAGCSQARAVLPVPMETASLSLAQPQTFGSTEEAARSIATVLNQGFGLPLPRRVDVFVYLGRLAFERGLVVEEGLSQARAAELSDFAIGIAGRRQLLLNQGGFNRTDRE